MGVFTPVLPSLAGWVGDVPVFQEILRWFGADDPLDVAEVQHLSPSLHSAELLPQK